MPLSVVLIRWLNGNASQWSLRSPRLRLEETSPSVSLAFLSVATLSSLIAILRWLPIPSVLALGICNTLTVSLAYTLLETSTTTNSDERVAEKEASNGSPYHHPFSASPTREGIPDTVIRDVSVISMTGCLVASYLIEEFRFDGLHYDRVLEGRVEEDWKAGMKRWSMLGFFLAVITGFGGKLLMFNLVCEFQWPRSSFLFAPYPASRRVQVCQLYQRIRPSQCR